MWMSKFSLLNGNCIEHTPRDVGIGPEIIYFSYNFSSMASWNLNGLPSFEATGPASQL